MTFKASFNYTPIRIIDKELPYNDRKFIFTKSQIFYSQKENRNWVFDNLKVLNGDYYELVVTDNIDRLLRYEIIINRQHPIRLALDSKNEFLLKWTHKLCYIQKDSSNWLKTAIIGLIFSIFTYFLGQFIGFKNGYQDGLKKAQLEIQQLAPQQTKK
jgi:hypothetical protein